MIAGREGEAKELLGKPFTPHSSPEGCRMQTALVHGPRLYAKNTASSGPGTTSLEVISRIFSPESRILLNVKLRVQLPKNAMRWWMKMDTSGP